MQAGRVSLGIRSIDNLLGGGIEKGSITQLYGEGGTGKTNLCLHLAARTALSGLWTVYLDTEGMSMERLGQIAIGQGVEFQQVLGHLLLTTPKSLEEQEKAIERTSSVMLRKEQTIGLVVVDSLTLLYRLSFGQDEEESARQSLSMQMAKLLHSSLESSVPVVVTNQVWRDQTSATFEPIGGSFLNHVCKTIIRIDRLKDGWRRAVLMKHRSLPEGGSADFRLTTQGVVTS